MNLNCEQLICSTRATPWTDARIQNQSTLNNERVLRFFDVQINPYKIFKIIRHDCSSRTSRNL